MKLSSSLTFVVVISSFASAQSQCDSVALAIPSCAVCTPIPLPMTSLTPIATMPLERWLPDRLYCGHRLRLPVFECRRSTISCTKLRRQCLRRSIRSRRRYQRLSSMWLYRYSNSAPSSASSSSSDHLVNICGCHSHTTSTYLNSYCGSSCDTHSTQEPRLPNPTTAY